MLISDSSADPSEGSENAAVSIDAARSTDKRMKVRSRGLILFPDTVAP